MKIGARNNLIKKSVEDLSFSVILEHEKGQEFGRLRPSYYLLKSSQIIVETSTEDIAEYFTNQMGNKTEEVFKNEVVDWAKTNGYNYEDANYLGGNAKKLVDCKKNSTLSSEKWKFNTTTNNSCISCEQINGLSSIYTHANLINGTETIATLKLLYSLSITINNISKCEFDLTCINISGD
ncbi:7762_t:CDS:2, partial [Gigaspora rosea]